MTFEQLNPQTQKEILNTIQSHPTYRTIMLEIQKARANYDYVKVFQLNKKLETIKQSSIKACLECKEEEFITLGSLFNEMGEERKSKAIFLVNAICFYCDMIDGLSTDLNELLKSLKGSPTVHMYDELIKAGKEAKKQLTFMAESTDMDFQINFADIADEVNELVFNKVKAFERKMNKQKYNA